jgi:Tfp pilus assembly protein PilW
MRHIASGGFTIVEMLVAMLVGLLVMIGLHQMFVASVTTEATTSSQMEVDRKAQVAMDDITSRLRQSAPSALRNVPAILDEFDSSHPDRIHFAAPPRADLEPATDANGQAQDVRYWFNSGALKRKIGGTGYAGGVVLADSATLLTFTFYRYDPATKSLVTPSTAAQTVAVQVQLTITEGRLSSHLQSKVRLRNM